MTALWSTVATIALKLIGAFITKRTQDKEAERKFLELATHLQAKKLISARTKFERSDRLDRHRKKAEEKEKNMAEARSKLLAKSQQLLNKH